MKLLNDVLDSAHKTEIECKIIDEINSGRIYDLKEKLKGYKVECSDGTTTEILSDDGIYLLFDSLYSPGSPDPMSTVNLLCQHSGLSEDFCRVLIGKFEINKFKNMYFGLKDRLKKVKQETDLCKKLYNDFISTKPTNYTTASQQFLEILNKNFGSNTKSMKSYIKHFKNFSESLLDLSNIIENKENLSKERKEKITKELLQITHQKSINQIVYNFSSHLKKFNDSSIELEKGEDTIQNLKLSKFSTLQNTKDIFLKALESLRKLGYIIGEEAEKLMDKLYVETSDDINILI